MEAALLKVYHWLHTIPESVFLLPVLVVILVIVFKEYKDIFFKN